MKIKTEILLLAVVIIALGLYLGLHRSGRMNYQLPVLTKIAKKDISGIEIIKAGKTIRLKRTDDSWIIAPQGYPADSGKINAMLEVIANPELTALISESRNYTRYELDDGKKINLRVHKGDTLARTFDIGKTASSFQHTFIKLKEDPRVFQARGNFRRDFDATAEDLRDKIVLAFEPNTISEIILTRKTETMVLKKGGSPPAAEERQKDQVAVSSTKTPSPQQPRTIWQTADGRRTDGDRLQRLLSTLSKLRCQKYLTDRKKADLTDPVFTARLKGLQEYRLSLFAPPEGDDVNYPAISSGNDYPFEISKWQAEEIMKAPDEITTKTDK